jgi:hypothetical protein
VEERADHDEPAPAEHERREHEHGGEEREPRTDPVDREGHPDRDAVPGRPPAEPVDENPVGRIVEHQRAQHHAGAGGRDRGQIDHPPRDDCRGADQQRRGQQRDRNRHRRQVSHAVASFCRA